MTDDIIHVVLDLLSIKTTDYDSSKSVINDDFDVNRPRIFAGCIYDKDTGLNALR